MEVLLERVTIAAFCMVLLLCVFLNLPILLALALGLCIFFAYGLKKGHTLGQLTRMSLAGIRTVKNILRTFLLIGILTGLWRLAGVIPVIICDAVRLVRPSSFLVMAFLLNCGISFLTGTSFGTAATMGVICAAMGTALQVPAMLTGGAILSGVYFGDRCSPVSTSALLIADLTKTDIFTNLRRMAKTALPAFLASVLLYTLIGLKTSHTGTLPDIRSLFAGAFHLHWTALLPAAVMLLLSALRLDVKLAMGGSILAALPLCVLLQGASWREILRTAVLGYTAADPAVGSMLNGGGIWSMVRVAAIVCLSSAYAGIFRETGLLDGFRKTAGALSRRVTPFGAVLCTAGGTAVIACNQTLTILLAHQLCGEIGMEQEELAIALEDTAVVLAPLVPWSIAGAVPLAAVGAPERSLLAACFLYLLPISRLLLAWRDRKKSAPSEKICQ